jgi:hypothetical protein
MSHALLPVVPWIDPENQYLEQCASCDDYLVHDSDSGENLKLDGTWLSDEPLEWDSEGEKMVCPGCIQSEWEHSSSVVRFLGEEEEVVKFGDILARLMPYYEEELPDWFTTHFGTRTYHRTDAWRGFYETPVTGLDKFSDGWVTGMPDDSVSHKIIAGELCQYLKVNGGPDFPVYWLFEPTSNVFSTASEIRVPEGRLNAFRKWLKENGFDPHDIERAFN